MRQPSGNFLRINVNSPPSVSLPTTTFHRPRAQARSGPSALHTMVGWNIEIMFMFALSGIIFARTLRDGAGALERWATAAAYSAFCVVVELVLHRGGLLVWSYSFWTGTPAGVPLIFLLGYFHFYAAAILVMRARPRTQVIAIAAIYATAIALDVLGLGVLGWDY